MYDGGDRAEVLCDAVRRAFEAGRTLWIAGSGSKAFLTGMAAGADGASSGRLLSVAEHSGGIDHRPEELVISARAGTPLREIERTLARAGQHLPFEPPRFRGGGTLGGAVACGLAGPGRPWRGGVRDALLGVELVNGRGERLRFGGQVMKNVAGYDLSRLQAGAFGTLGVLLSVTLRVLPVPAAECTQVFECSGEEALARCRSWGRRPYPLTGACHLHGRLYVRLSGAAPAVDAARAEIGGETEPDSPVWTELRDHRLDWFGQPGLWRCSLAPAAPRPLTGCLINWAGAERWWRPEHADGAVEILAEQGGHGRPFDAGFGLRHGPHVGAAERQYAARLKRAFDPAGILNPELCPLPETPRAD